ncbi:putative lysine decarboxylase [Hymenopellis radicata]|nr:putative lysine decarboxylase [Hymenopellis radicata]
MSPSSTNAVAVYCGSLSGTQPAYVNAAISLGIALARANRRLVYGGGVNGIMGAVSKSVLQNGGHVTGVTPTAIAAVELQDHEGLTDDQRSNIVVASMHERKVEMAVRAGGFVGLPGGFGTLEEVMEVATWTQLGIHTKRRFIKAVNQHIITFVDGPSSFSEHDDFDWGAATLEALDAWIWEGGKPLFNWSQPGASEGEKLKAT